jgi:hypothetical protein
MQITALPNIPSSVVKAFESFNKEQKAVFLGRYVCNDTIKQTCDTLDITPEKYQVILAQCMNLVRRVPRAAAAAASFESVC